MTLLIFGQIEFYISTYSASTGASFGIHKVTKSQLEGIEMLLETFVRLLKLTSPWTQGSGNYFFHNQ
jgi:hypothetical protein